MTPLQRQTQYLLHDSGEIPGGFSTTYDGSQCLHLRIWRAGFHPNGTQRSRCALCGKYFITTPDRIPRRRLDRLTAIAPYFLRGETPRLTSDSLGICLRTVQQYFQELRKQQLQRKR